MRVVRFIINYLEKRRQDSIRFAGKGSNVIFGKDVNFISPEKISIGNNVYIGPYASIYGQGKISIGNGVIIGPKLTIYSANHNFKDNPVAIPYDSKLIEKEVVINENVWIGGNVILLPGVNIGEGAIVGAGSVVTKNINPFEIVGGNPAKVIGHRDVTIYNQLKEEDKIYLKLRYAKI